MKDYQNFFNRDFYPTPPEAIDRMMSMSDVRGKIVLEPSFGSGNIVRWLNANGAKEVIGCEINDKLRMSADCRVLCADFFDLTAEQVSHIDMIVMNPPFSNCEKHILHAWEIAPAGCEIVTLCNANLIDGHGRYGTRETINDLVGLYGSKEVVGDVFKEAERRTDCMIGLVRLYKNGENGEEFSKYFTDEEDNEEVGEGIIKYNEVREAVQRYVQAVNMFDGVMEASRAINDVTAVFGSHSIKFGAYECGYDKTNKTITKDVFRKELQKKAWRWIFSKFNMDRFVTRSVYNDINKAIELQSNIPFTMRNIYRMIEMIIGTHEDRMNRVICEAFDMISKYSSDNVTYHGETWKTNSAHMVNRKFIVPYACEVGWKGYVQVRYEMNGQMTDILKALCHVTGTRYEWTETDSNGVKREMRMRDLYGFCHDQDLQFGQWYSFGFFEVKFFKKGTMHCMFQNEETWYKFNQIVAKARGWRLPINVKVKNNKK